MKTAIALCLAVVAAGCSSSSAIPVFAPDGSVAYQVRCSAPEPACEDMRDPDCATAQATDPLADCKREASKYCPAGVRIVADTAHFAGTRHVVLAICQAR